MDKLGGSTIRMKAIEELLRGRDSATQLRSVINGNGEDSPSAEKLVKEVLMSFTNSLLLLNDNPTSEFHDASNVQLWASPKLEDSQESNCKNSTVKARRGCYKRRNYFRCTHRDQGCQATKQVQRVQEDPILYKTIYYGEHSCKNMGNPEIILDMSPSSSSKFLSFNNSFSTQSQQECPFLSSSFPSSVKRECKEEIPPSTSSNDYLISSDLTFDGSPKHVTLSSSTPDSEYKAVDFPDIFDDVFEGLLEFR
ncbi:WRKY transcription factor 67 WRKY DNA-binding protein [Vigna angularis]|uniref:WRKY transcription factor 67 WRKY DNA-binding protein n=1 Tax=Phaseolus angularis TaxID=3914 RepID=A0A8T0KZ44_PHAAN|nr:WRKY transcription factor 67 WRKY DNA-binding protein [Vigna angularis]